DEAGPIPAPGFAVINGARNPELLLPWEIFQHFLSQTFNPVALLQEDFRRRAAELAPGGELPVSFWARLQFAGSEFLNAVGTRRALLNELARTPEAARAPILSRIEAASEGYCQKRLRALERARNEFGADWFDRFLYLAVAPDIGMVWPENESWPEQLRQVEEGCQ
ncbi:MAG: hypothetical protein ACRDGN_11415, partial [bacterium]